MHKLTDLHFELYEIMQGANSVVLYYKSVLGKNAMEVMFLNDDEKINKVFADYS